VRRTARSTTVTTITGFFRMPPSRVAAQETGATAGPTTDAGNAMLRNSVGGHRQENGDGGDSGDAQNIEGAA
jgi:hypothetical protein